MPFRKPFLTDLCRLGKPLIDINISVPIGVDLRRTIEDLNALGSDLEVRESRYNSFPSRARTSPQLIDGDASREALRRIFEWQVERIAVPTRDSVPHQLDGAVAATFFTWYTFAPPRHIPSALAGRLADFGIEQPGSCDDGQADLLTYDQAPIAEGEAVEFRSYPEMTIVFGVWRQDDHGHRFHVLDRPSKAEADAEVARFESHGHRQSYWVEPRFAPNPAV